MCNYTAEDYRHYIQNLIRKSHSTMTKEEICNQLNEDFPDETFYLDNGTIYLDCSDYSPRDVYIYS